MIRIPIYKSLYLFILILGVAVLSLIDFSHGATWYNATTPMNASITIAVAITPSTALADGIQFGTIVMNTNNNLAINDSTNENVILNRTGANATDYNLTVDSTTTHKIDFFNKAQYAFLNNTAGDEIGITNVTLEANLSIRGDNVNYTIAYEPNSITLSDSWAGIGSTSTTDNLPCNNTPADGTGNCSMIYFLDVPNNQPSGTYNTTYCFCAVEVGTGVSLCSC